MKIKRYKKLYKNLSFYVNYFQFRAPYQILIDATFCFAAQNNKVNIKDNIPKYLQDDCKFLTTQCVIIETEKLGSRVFGALVILKQFSLHKCGHEGKPIGAAECLLSMTKNGNSNHYIIATQDRDLQKHLRQIPGVPLLYLHQKTPILEHPSLISVQKASEIKSQRFGLSQYEIDKLEEIKQEQGITKEKQMPVKKKRKGGPNPLSCKKKKRHNLPDINVANKNSSSDKIRRKKIRIPKHLKDLKKQSDISVKEN